MGLFDFLRSPEERFYKKFKKLYDLKKGEKLTISSLQVRVETCKLNIKDLEQLNAKLQEEKQKLITDSLITDSKPFNNIRFNNASDEESLLKIKIVVLYKIHRELKEDAIRGIRLKLTELDDEEILKKLEENLKKTDIDIKYNHFVTSVRHASMRSHRLIGMEEIKNFKFLS